MEDSIEVAQKNLKVDLPYDPNIVSKYTANEVKSADKRNNLLYCT